MNIRVMMKPIPISAVVCALMLLTNFAQAQTLVLPERPSECAGQSTNTVGR
jgi:hypothetical protein